MAAVGGMVVPAMFFFVLNRGGEGAHGWGIPMATDIAFALGVLAIFGTRAPLGLKVFLTALAIADDLGAVAVIAIFYTEKINVLPLVVAAVLLTFGKVPGKVPGTLFRYCGKILGRGGEKGICRGTIAFS